MNIYNIFELVPNAVLTYEDDNLLIVEVFDFPLGAWHHMTHMRDCLFYIVNSNNGFIDPKFGGNDNIRTKIYGLWDTYHKNYPYN